jgi:hypothetical protein
MDLDGNGLACPNKIGEVGDRLLLHQLGLFFPVDWPLGTGRKWFHSPDTVIDGLSNTIMLAENVRAGHDPSTPSSWAQAKAVSQTFILSSFVCENDSCSPGKVDYGRSNDRLPPYAREAINASLFQPESRSPWPVKIKVSGTKSSHWLLPPLIHSS